MNKARILQIVLSLVVVGVLGFTYWQIQYQKTPYSDNLNLNLFPEKGKCPKYQIRYCCDSGYCNQKKICSTVPRECNGQDAKENPSCFIYQWKTESEGVCDDCHKREFVDIITKSCE